MSLGFLDSALSLLLLSGLFLGPQNLGEQDSTTLSAKYIWTRATLSASRNPPTTRPFDDWTRKEQQDGQKHGNVWFHLDYPSEIPST